MEAARWAFLWAVLGNDYGFHVTSSTGKERAVGRQAIFTPNAPEPRNAYVQGISANGFVFVTGQVSRDPKSGEFVDGPFDDQFRRCIKNLQAILVAGGTSLENVVKLTIYMTDHADLDAMNRILDEFFPNPPTRSSFGVGFLWKKCKVMIDAIAIAG
jgi:2-iminobutanoate/2-iminopropanoate deaminase